MPQRPAVSRHVSPASEDNINVAMPRLITPSAHALSNLQSKPQPTSSRPKRKISKPARYSDHVFEPPTKKRASAVSVVSSRKSTPAPTEPDPVLCAPGELVKQRDPELEGFDRVSKPAGYSADFLTNFIDDSAPSTDTGPSPESDAKREFGFEPDRQPASDVVPDSASGYEPSTDSATFAPHATTFIGHDPQLISSTPIPACPVQLDSPEEIIHKLQAACHALSNLNIPTVPTSAQLQSPQQTQQSKGTVSLPGADSSGSPAGDGVQFLLDAAVGSDSSDSKDSPTVSVRVSIGEPDEDLLFLIHNAIQILRSHIVSKNHLDGRAGCLTSGKSSKARRGAKKYSRKSQSNFETEQFAMSALEQLLGGGATNVNCLVSKERGHLVWHLYTHLQHLVMAPQFALPRQYHFLPQTVNGMMATNIMGPPTMGPPIMMMQHQPPPVLLPQPNGVPTPHQFLGRSNPGQYISPYSINPVLMDQFKTYEHGQGHVPILSNPALPGGYPGRDTLRHDRPIPSQPTHDPFLTMPPNFQLPYNTFPPILHQATYLPTPTQRATFHVPSFNNFNFPQRPFGYYPPAAPPNSGFPAAMAAFPSQFPRRSRPKLSKSSQPPSNRTAAPGGKQRHPTPTPTPANVSVQRAPAPATLGND